MRSILLLLKVRLSCIKLCYELDFYNLLKFIKLLLGILFLGYKGIYGLLILKLLISIFFWNFSTFLSECNLRISPLNGLLDFLAL